MNQIYQQISTFMSHCQYEKNLSPKTIRSYRMDLEQLIMYLKTNCNSYEIDKQALRGFIQSISHFKPKTIKRKIASVKVFLNFLECEDAILVNPFRKLKIQIKEPKKLPTVMSLLEIEQILRKAYEDKKNAVNQSYGQAEKKRNVAVLELLFATGARVSEISGLKKSNIDLSTGYIKLKGKGNKERMIQVCNAEVMGAVKEYYHSFQQQINKQDYFFINRFNSRLSEQSIRFLVKHYSLRAGIERNITPHVFRHSFATLLLEEDVDIKYIQHLLGHSSIITTQIYTHVNAEKQKEILTQKHPRKNLQIGVV